MSEAETKVLVGRCVEYSVKNGWHKFEIDHGGQYKTALSTKVQAIVEAGLAVGEDTATWTYKESQGNENPNKPGTFYKNRYLDKVEAGEHAPTTSPAGGSSAPTPHHDPIAEADKQRAISRMSCLSSAANLLQGVEFETEGKRIAAWLAAARAAETFVYRDIDESPEVDGDDIPFE